jgi:hypothetical protein
MNFRLISENDLADFAANVATLLAGTDLPSIDPAVRTDLATAIGTLPTTLATQTAESAIAEDERKASVSSKNDTRFQLIALMSQVRDALKAGLAPKKQYDLCGFDYRKEAATVIASDPTDLSGEGRSNGVNYLRWSGNNKTGTVVYELWRLHGDTAPWTLHATTKKQSFTDAPVTPGQVYNYKVRAVAATNASNFSNVAVIYGSI